MILTKHYSRSFLSSQIHKQTLRVLLMEGNPADSRLVEEMLVEGKNAGLPSGIQLLHANRLSNGLSYITDDQIDVVLLDLALPDSKGLETLEVLHKRAPTLPIIVLTAFHDETLGLEAVRAGAQDYLLKEQLDTKTLLRAIRYAVERKRIEEALREQEERFKIVARATNDAVWDWNLITNAVWWNEGVQTLFGYREKDIGPDANWWYDHIHPEDRERVVSGIHAVINSGVQFWSDEYRYRRADGSYVYIYDRGFVIHDKDGRPVRMIGGMVDISDRKHIEELLRERERSFSKQRTALLQLARHKIRSEDDFHKVLQEIMKISAITMDVERTSIWLYNRDRSKIRCIELYEKSLDRHLHGDELIAENYPSYFKAIEEDRTIAAHDALSDPRTKEFSQSYLISLGITSMLDAPIRIGGYVVGVVCHEHVGPKRQWSPEEQSFAGSIADFVSLAMEQRELERAEEALRDSESRFRLIVEQVPAIIWAIDKKLNITLSLGAGLSGLRLKPNQLVGMSLYEYLKTDYPQFLPVGAHLRALQGEPCAYELEWQGCMFQTYVEPLRDKTGNVIGVVGVALDITERKRVDTILQEQSAAMKASMDGMAILNKNEEYVYLNEAHARIYGYDSPSELIGKTWRVLYDQKELRRFEKDIMPTFWKEGRWRGEAVGKKKNGSLFAQEVSLTAIEGGGLVCVVRDISERKKTEQELEEYRMHLEDLVEERTRKLRQSERLAATGRLAASIAHEINNPLQGIITHLEIIRDHLPGNFEKIHNYEFVRNNIEKIKEIVVKLLDTYRTVDEEKAPVDIHELLDKVVSLLEHQLELQGVELELDYASGLPRIKGWKQQLYQVFLNILINAQDSIKTEKGKIAVRTYRLEDAIAIDIADTGEGIPEEHMGHIFDPFFTTKAESGTGLGLFVSQGIVKEHNGYIKVKSQVGQGSTFTVVLPV